ncbi:unnamed protein product [Leptidea sinapis]|uniref:Uncharacterized protein n=1 Tax=Leptidea sinapis TaxID=189913 RepID=A0A5E4QTY2_9NEOP|nr:unnamed protein product [Leptidea sinapis]
MQRLRTADGSPPPVVPAGGVASLEGGAEGTSEDNSSVGGNIGMEGQSFRLPLPVNVRPRLPVPAQHRPEHQMLMQQRMMTSEGQQQQNIANILNQHNMEQKQAMQAQGNVSSNETKQEGNTDQGSDEMDIGDMDKLEQDSGNIGEVDILTGLGAEDDEQLLESLTAEIGEQFNILEYADPELGIKQRTSWTINLTATYATP